MTESIRRHLSSAYEDDLDRLRHYVLSAGALVERQIADATLALINADEVLADRVATTDLRINRMEVEVDEECTRILARRQPTATDLRLVYTVNKAITDLERMGDEAAKIARMAKQLARQERFTGSMREIQHLSRQVATMLHDVLDAFMRNDADAALAVARQDRLVDYEYEALMRQCITYMMEDSRSIGRVMSIIWCVRSLERIGDHAKSVAQHVYYLVRGEDIRLQPLHGDEGALNQN